MAQNARVVVRLILAYTRAIFVFSMMRNSSMSRREHGVTPTDETHTMTAEERSHIEAMASNVRKGHVVVTRLEALPPTDGVEYGFEELVDTVKTEETLADNNPHPVDRTSAGHRRAQNLVHKHLSSPPDAHEVTLDTPTHSSARHEAQRPFELRESTKTEQEVIITALTSALGTKLDIAIAFLLLERISTELPDGLLDYCTMTKERIREEMTLVQEANKANIDMPYTVAQLQKALDYLDEQTR